MAIDFAKILRRFQRRGRKHEAEEAMAEITTEAAMPITDPVKISMPISSQSLVALEDTVSLNTVRVVRVGKDVSEFRKWHQGTNTEDSVHRGYSYYYENDPILHTNEPVDIPEDAVPYLDDCDYEVLAAQLARQQSLIRRQLYRMSMLWHRPPTSMV
ncbi:hypothetical protein GGI07_001807 [Coemansia sp. Benny D115]|nr:hypothetical protein GGI07_001807 [Coemansia sp. Benny D115]